MKNRILIAFVVLLMGAAALPAQSQAAQAPAAQPAAAPAAHPAATPAVKSWLIRLIPPRPTFAQDATPAEQALMQQHFVYWKDLNAKGVCVFGGPVLDPKGVYGILVVRAATEDEARALGEGDPSVKAGVNRIEVAEMRVAFMPAAPAAMR